MLREATATLLQKRAGILGTMLSGGFGFGKRKLEREEHETQALDGYQPPPENIVDGDQGVLGTPSHVTRKDPAPSAHL